MTKTFLSKVNIIASGSSGNCVVVDDIMFDCGVPWKKIEEATFRINYLCITHHHGDHINKSTLAKIRKLRPWIRIVMDGSSLYETHPNIDIKSIPVPHDVPCYAYYITRKDKGSLLYATDLTSTAGLPYADIILLEANYDELKLPEGEVSRHLSKQEHDRFILGMHPYDSYELHKSTRYY